MVISERCLGCPNIVFYQREILIYQLQHEIDLVELARDMAERKYLDEQAAIDSQEEERQSFRRKLLEKSLEGAQAVLDSGNEVIVIAESNIAELQTGCKRGLRYERRYKIFGGHVALCSSKKQNQLGVGNISLSPDPDVSLLTLALNDLDQG